MRPPAPFLLASGASAGLALGLFEIVSHAHLAHGHVRLAAGTLVRRGEQGLLVALAVWVTIVAAVALASWLLGRIGLAATAPVRLARVVVALAWAAAFALALGFQANTAWLPHKLHWQSLTADLAIVLLALFTVWPLALVPWERALTHRIWRKAAVALAAVVLLAHAALGLSRVVAPPRGPSVVLVVVDTLRADRLGPYGGARPVSPNIDRLASRALVFDRAIAPAPWTSPSVASMLTGLAPAELGYTLPFPPRLPDRFATLAERFRDRGYRTAGIVAHDFLSRALGFAQGFERWDESDAGGHGSITSGSVTDKALAFLEEADRDRPFFLFLHYFDPHFDFIEHPGHVFGAPYEGCVTSGHPILDLHRLAGCLGPPDIQRLFDIYDSEIAFTDEHLGRLFDRLAEPRHAGTVVVFTADHGESFAERGTWIGHTKLLYQEVVHVPLLAAGPGIVSRRVGDTFSLSRLPELIDALLAGSPQAGLDSPGPAISETRRMAQMVSVVLGPHKLIWDLEDDRRVLYDLVQDPGERVDLAPERSETVEELEHVLRDHLARTGARAPSPETPRLSPQQLERLRSLGYVD